jgi:hypothetical protein
MIKAAPPANTLPHKAFMTSGAETPFLKISKCLGVASCINRVQDGREPEEAGSRNFDELARFVIGAAPA